MTNQGGNPPGQSPNNQPVPSFNDFLDSWRKAAADSEQRWNDYFNELMGTEAFAQVMSRSMDGYLAMQSTFAKGMEQYLRAMNIPTRTDVTQLAERVAMLEQKIDAMATLLGEPASESDGRESSGGRRRRGGKKRD